MVNSLLTMIINSFKDSFYSKTWKHFHFLFFIFFALKFIPSLKTLAKFRMIKTSKTQVHLFHAHADIKARFTSFKSAFKNKNIHEQKQGDRP